MFDFKKEKRKQREIYERVDYGKLAEPFYDTELPTPEELSFRRRSMGLGDPDEKMCFHKPFGY
ncbi:MAG: hypothetical protein ABIH79_00910 [archaeon]